MIRTDGNESSVSMKSFKHILSTVLERLVICQQAAKSSHTSESLRSNITPITSYIDTSRDS